MISRKLHNDKKVIAVLPQLAQERNQLAMMQLPQNIGELQQVIGA